MKTKQIKEIIGKLKPAFKSNDMTGFGKYLYIYNKKAIAYNGNLAIMLDLDLDLEVALPIDEFEKFVNRVKKDEFTIEVDDAIEMKAGRIKATFARNEDMLAKIKKVHFDEPKEYKTLPEDFLKGLGLVQFSISKDMSRPAYTYMYIHDNKMASTDNFRVSEYTMKSEMDEVKIPRDTVQYLSKYDLVEYSLNESLIYFKTKDNILIMSEIGNLEFADYQRLFKMEGDLFEFPKETKDLVETVEITVDGISDLDKSIDVDIVDGKIIYSSRNEVGEIEGDREIDSDLEFSFKVSPIFLKQILEITDTAIIGEGRMLFETDNFKQLIALFNSERK